MLSRHRGETTLSCCYGNYSALSNISDIIIGDDNITTSPSVCNLGAIFDEHLTMEAHVNGVWRVFFPPALEQDSKSAGYEDSCRHRPSSSHFLT